MKYLYFKTFTIIVALTTYQHTHAHKDQDKIKKNIARHHAIENKKAKQELERIDQRRIQAYNTIANKLSCLSDVQIQEMLSKETQWTQGYGKTAVIDIDNMPVFIKKIPLTDLELQPEHYRSTANIFNLPSFYQYGVGSAGFSAWRELAALIIASNWVITGQCKNFPMLYHWIVTKENTPDDVMPKKNLDKKVAYWNNSSAVRTRLESMQQANYSIVIFCESIPQTLNNYIILQGQKSKNEFEQAVKMADKNLQETASFMQSHGMLHFDAHTDNIMTDGHRLYFADFGLAISSLFNLSDQEKLFFNEHINYDKIYVQAELAFNILQALQIKPDDAINLLEKYTGKNQTFTYSPYITSILKKYAGSALLYEKFNTQLRKQSKLTPYPAQEIEKLLAAVKE